MVISPDIDISVEYLALTGPAFDDAVSGIWHGEGRITPSWLASPRLKYYMCRSALVRGPDRRQFFMGVQPAPDEDRPGLKKAVGILELEVSPYDDAVVWLKYITVHPDLQRQGIARTLLDMMVSHLSHNPRRLERSRPSEEGAVRIKGYIDELLNRQGLPWTQSGAY